MLLYDLTMGVLVNNPDVIITYILIWVVGLAVGSFLNVVIHRLPRGESINRPGSHCPHCKTPLRWYDNIPVISYVLLKGKCRQCHAIITPRYPIVELTNPALWTINYMIFGWSWYTLLISVVTTIFIIIAWIDIDEMLIPDSLNLILLVLSIIAIFVSAPERAHDFDVSKWDHLFGLSIAIGFLSIRMIGLRTKKTEIIGGGDIKLIAVVGLLLGWQLTLLGIMFASFLAVLVELPLRILKRKAKEDSLPFGPYLIFGFLLSLYYGSQIVHWYLSLIA